MQPHGYERALIEEAVQTAGTIVVAVDAHGRQHRALAADATSVERVAGDVVLATGATPLLAVAAASDGAIVTPSERIQQTLLARHPDVRVALPTSEGVRMRPIHELLPDVPMPSTGVVRVLRFHHRYADPVRDGSKRSTVRWREPLQPGPVLCVFEDHPDWPTVPATITAIARHPLPTLTPAQARMPDDYDMSTFAPDLRQHYPTMPDDAEVDVVDLCVEPATQGC